MCSFQKCRSVPLSAEKPVSTSSIWDQQCLSYLCNCLIANVYNVHRFAAVTRGWLQWERTAPDPKSTEAKEKVLLTPWIMESCLCYTNFWAIFVAKKQKQLFEGNKGFVLIFANCNEYFCEIFANWKCLNKIQWNPNLKCISFPSLSQKVVFSEFFSKIEMVKKTKSWTFFLGRNLTT